MLWYQVMLFVVVMTRSDGQQAANSCSQAHFSYAKTDKFNPAAWHTCWSHCRGQRQSPVNIPKTRSTKSTFKFSNFQKKIHVTIGNNGLHTHFGVTEKDIRVSNVPQRGRGSYILEQFHFHIGKTKSKGSEHSIDGQFYPMEGHMVFYNKKYGSVANAANKSDGLVVIGVLIQVGNGVKTDGCTRTFANKLKNLLCDTYRKIRKPAGDGKKVVREFRPKYMLPKEKRFYTYKGSLTTPPCYESVQWIVMKCPIMISKQAYNAVSRFQIEDGIELKEDGNRRPIQRRLISG